MARANRRSVDQITRDIFRSDRWEQQELPLSKARKATPAWVVHRKGLSDTPRTSAKTKAHVRYMKRQAERAFRKWHEECQKRKQRKEVLIAKGVRPGSGKKPTQPGQRKPASRLRCP